MADRPSQIELEHRGVKAIVSFHWGAENDPVPKGLRITFDRVNDPVIALLDKANYSSFEQAREHGLKFAKLDIDRVLGPDPDA